MHDWNNKKCVDFYVNCGPAGRPALFFWHVSREYHEKCHIPMIVGSQFGLWYCQKLRLALLPTSQDRIPNGLCHYAFDFAFIH